MNEPVENKTECLLRFLQGRDQACPTCDYNLRDLTRPVCPECGEELKLAVGRRKYKDSLLFLTIAPCIFSGMCAVLLNGLIAYVSYSESGLPPMWVWGLDGFGLSSGLAGLLLFVNRRAFVKRDRGVQLLWALLTWAIHVTAFVVLVVSV